VVFGKWLVKFPLKFLWQLVLLFKFRRYFLEWDFCWVKENWPKDSPLRRERHYTGIQIATIQLPLEKLFVINDRPKIDPNRKLKPPFIPLQESTIFEAMLTRSEATRPEHPAWVINRIARIQTLRGSLDTYQCRVLLTWNGTAEVVDGRHRLIAKYLDGAFPEEIDLKVTL